MFQKPTAAAVLLGVAVLMLVFYAGKTYTESTIASTIIIENEENEQLLEHPAHHHANTQTAGEERGPHHHVVAEAAPIEVVTVAPAPTPAPRVVPPPAVPPPPFKIEELKPFAHAQYGEDLYALKTFFPGKHGGTILESGALDGLLFSSTFVFELKMDWRAIHVEASPVSFSKLAKNRVSATNVNAALCESAGTVHYIGPENSAVSGAVGGIIEFMRPDMLEFNWPKDGTGTRHGIYGGGKAVIYPIECRRMDAILADSNVTHVDLWVLDVEGAELAVLQTIDLTKVRIDVIAIELDGGNKQKDEGVVKHLQANGYVVHSKYPEQNTWFVRKDFVVPSQ